MLGKQGKKRKKRESKRDNCRRFSWLDFCERRESSLFSRLLIGEHKLISAKCCSVGALNPSIVDCSGLMQCLHAVVVFPLVPLYSVTYPIPNRVIIILVSFSVAHSFYFSIDLHNLLLQITFLLLYFIIHFSLLCVLCLCVHVLACLPGWLLLLSSLLVCWV